MELVLVAPALLALALVIAAASSISGARGDVDDAAWEAARAASLTRSAGDAQATADRAVIERLDGRRWHCQDRKLNLDTPRFAPGGAAAVTLTCQLHLNQALPLLPGVITLQARSSQPLERYRGMR